MRQFNGAVTPAFTQIIGLSSKLRFKLAGLRRRCDFAPAPTDRRPAFTISGESVKVNQKVVFAVIWSSFGSSRLLSDTIAQTAATRLVHRRRC